MSAICDVVCACASLVALAGSAAAQVGFRPATELVAVEPPPNIVPLNAGRVILGLSERYVYGERSGAYIRAFAVSGFTAPVPLPLPPGAVASLPVGVSNDGRRVVGLIGYPTAGLNRVVRWDDGGDPQIYLVGNSFSQRPCQTDAMCDRWVVVTGLSAFEARSYLAEPDGFLEVSPYGDEETVSTSAKAISPDGHCVAGQFNGVTGPAFVWNDDGESRQLDPWVAPGTLPQFVSDGGGTVVCGDGGLDVLRDVGVAGVYIHGGIRTDAHMYCTALSRDGLSMVGYSLNTPYKATWWSETLGVEDLNDALSARGIDLRGWTLREARYISDDGRTLVGRGTAPGSSAMRWWVATIEPRAAADMGKAGGRFGSDGKLDNNDFIAFIDKFFAADARADVGRAGGERGGDGAFDTNDFCAFIGLFFGGQP